MPEAPLNLGYLQEAASEAWYCI